MSEWSSGFAVPKPLKRVKIPKRLATGNGYKDKSITQEDEFAARMTADTGIKYRRVPGSGSIPGHPGDAEPDHRVKSKWQRWLIEMKEMAVTTARGEHTLSIKLEWLKQIMTQADAERCLPALGYRFTGDNQTWMVVRYEDFSELLKQNKIMEDFIES